MCIWGSCHSGYDKNDPGMDASNRSNGRFVTMKNIVASMKSARREIGFLAFGMGSILFSGDTAAKAVRFAWENADTMKTFHKTVVGFAISAGLLGCCFGGVICGLAIKNMKKQLMRQPVQAPKPN